MRNELDEKINVFVSELRNEDLGRKLKYVDSHGKEYERNFGGLILQKLRIEYPMPRPIELELSIAAWLVAK